eukprot:snap_masked-scaffold_29-processed-gene-2.30-mRNA-1 protein AED:1.00 eAED:1.00 QI:0/0/0/0/1/1/2/0/150
MFCLHWTLCSGKEEITEVVSESEPTSTQRLQGLPDFTSRRRMSAHVVSFNFGGLAQYKLSTVVKFTYELPSPLSLFEEATQKGVDRLEKASEDVSQNRKERLLVSQADYNSTGVATFMFQELLPNVTVIYRVSRRILAIKNRSSNNKKTF